MQFPADAFFISTPVVLVLAADRKSFFAFELPEPVTAIRLQNDTLVVRGKLFRINGTGIDSVFSLKPLQAYQEFWHSWRTFNPGTAK